jgi:hypothetical protein
MPTHRPGIPIFPRPTAVPTRPCAKCQTPVQVQNLVAGAYGSHCADELGLTVTAPRLRAAEQSGYDLIDYLAEIHDPDDECDGWDR